MSTWKTDDKSMLLLRCNCGAGETLLLYDLYNTDEEYPDTDIEVEITCTPDTFREKLRAVWRLLRGTKYIGFTDCVLLTEEDADNLAKWVLERLTTRKGEGNENIEEW